MSTNFYKNVNLILGCSKNAILSNSICLTFDERIAMTPNKKRETLLYPGLQMGDWVLKKWTGTDNKQETWEAINAKDSTVGTIAIDLNNPNQSVLQRIFNTPSNQALMEAVTENVFEAGDNLDGWKLDTFLGRGATSEIWRATREKDGIEAALKIYTSKHKTQFDSFCNEIDILKHLDKSGLCPPLIDAKICQDLDSDEFSWQAMAEIEQISPKLKNSKQASELIEATLTLIDLIEKLAKKGIYYKDLKLEHLATYNGEPVLFDFGSASLNNPDEIKKGKIARDKVHTILHRIIATTQDMLMLQDYEKKNLLIWLQDARHCNTLQELRDFFHQWQTQAKKQNCADPEIEYCIMDDLKKAADCYNQGKIDDAERYFQSVLDHSKDNADALHMLGVIKNQKGEQEEGLKLMHKAMDLFPDNPSHNCNLANTYYQCGEYEKAMHYAEKAIKYEPHFYKAYECMAMSRHAIEGKKKKQQSMDKAKELLKHANPEELSSLSEVDKKYLESAFKEPLECTGQYGARMLYKTKEVDPKKADSYSAISWDQYFTDLSQGSYRNVHDGKRRAWRQRTWHYLFKNLAIINYLHKSSYPRINILDIGCSSGYFRRFIEGNRSPLDEQQWYYWGVDLREDMLHRAVYLTEDIESGAQGNSTPSAFVQQDLQYGLPFKDNFFHAVVNFEMIKYLPVEQGKFLLSEMQRVLIPNGHGFLSSSFTPQRAGFVEGMSVPDFQQMLQNSGFNTRAVLGSQSNYQRLLKHIKPEHKALVNELLKYHPVEIVNAMITPLYPNYASQLMFQLQKAQTPSDG